MNNVASGRLLSLDALRGFEMLFIMGLAGLVVAAKAGEMLTEADFSFGVAKEAYVVNIAAGGKSAMVALKVPEVRRLEDKPSAAADELRLCAG